jgi:predicted nucleotidyltransferase
MGGRWRRLDQVAEVDYIGGMDKDQVIAIIRKHEDALRAEGVLGLSLFGSVARGEATAESDIDVIVELTDEVLHSGFGYFGTLYRLKERLEDITGRPVDVISEPIEKPRLAKEIERDRQVAF